MLKRILIGSTLILAFASTAHADTKLSRRLKKLAKEAHNTSLSQTKRITAAKEYYWLSRSKKLCQYTEETQKNCEDALSDEQNFNPNHLCAGAEHSNDKSRCQAEGKQIEKDLEKLDRKKNSKTLPKWIINQANKAEKSPGHSADGSGSDFDGGSNGASDGEK